MSALKHVFVRVHARYEQDRYVEDLERFAAWLLRSGYPNKSCRTHLYRVQQVLHAINTEPGVVLQADVLQHAFLRLARRRWKYCHTYSTYAGYLRSIGCILETPASLDAIDTLVREFCERLTRRRGLAVSTVAGYRHWISDFLRQTLLPGRSLEKLPITSLESYIQLRGHGLVRTTLTTAIHCIQAFLLDCYRRELLPQRLDQVDLARGFRRDLPPRAIPWPLIERLLQSIECRDRVGRRDHAMLHLMAHYGLRPGELTHLTLDSINWRARTLTVWQPKTQSTLVLPLHDQTLNVLRDYIDLARPQTDLSWLFIRGSAPLAQMTTFSASSVFRTRARRSGLPLAGYSSYSLRHAFAHRLFQHGVGMKAIGDLMGHRSLVSTSVYLRLQSELLREVALQVPSVARGDVA
ncbi:tyrosine-type recombinase/integrase [Burkholderia ubonensis]|uniref:tyrosine-type recombinase/integrase n=1 Tax=Burkholderia ubonensis TaxID=101571 RepID=UPI0007C66CDC|nr:tyrosine-type recombinase/integrase [Burkholderia ubonensis]